MKEPEIHNIHARSDILLRLVRVEVEREKGLEPSTFCLGSRRSAN